MKASIFNLIVKNSAFKELLLCDSENFSFKLQLQNGQEIGVSIRSVNGFIVRQISFDNFNTCENLDADIIETVTPTTKDEDGEMV